MATDPDIRLFSLSTCSHCKATKKMLDRQAVKYACIDLDLMDSESRRTVLQDLKKINPHCSFPTLVIDGTVIIGYREQEISAALEEK